MSSPWKMLPSVRPDLVLDVERRADLLVDDQLAEIGAGAADLGQDGVGESRARLVVPGAAVAQLVGGVLDEHGRHVLAGRRHGRVDLARDQQVEIGVGGPAPGLPVVVGALQALQRVRAVQVALEEGRTLGRGREVGHGVEGDVELARRAADLEPAHALEELLGQQLGVHVAQEGALDVHVGDDDGRVELVAVLQRHAGDQVVADQEALDAGAGADLAAGGLESARPWRG